MRHEVTRDPVVGVVKQNPHQFFSIYNACFFGAQEDEQRSSGSLPRGRGRKQQTGFDHTTFFTPRVVNQAIQATVVGSSEKRQFWRKCATRTRISAFGRNFLLAVTSSADGKI